jgi:uncharacterized protein
MKNRAIQGIAVTFRMDYRAVNGHAGSALTFAPAICQRRDRKPRRTRVRLSWRPRLAAVWHLITRPIAWLVAYLIAAAVVPAAAAPAAKDKPAAKIAARIAFAGDSIVDNYWEAIARVIEANTCLKSSVALGRFAHNGTGLSRGDKLYWPREVRRIGDTFKPDLFVLSIGLNDQQFIVDGNGARTAWGAPKWTDKYHEQILAFLNGAAASKAAVMLVGLPIVRDAKENADLQQKNKWFAEAVAAVGAPHMQYVEPWRLKPAGPDAFASYGPDRHGRMVQIRTSDGEHFTVAGEDLIGAYLYPKVVTALEQMGRPLDRACVAADRSVDQAADTAVAEKQKEP